MPTVLIPTAYRGPTKGVSEISVSGTTVRACLEDVETQHPGFLPLVLDREGELHRFVKLFVNEVQLDAPRPNNTGICRSSARSNPSGARPAALAVSSSRSSATGSFASLYTRAL